MNQEITLDTIKHLLLSFGHKIDVEPDDSRFFPLMIDALTRLTAAQHDELYKLAIGAWDA